MKVLEFKKEEDTKFTVHVWFATGDYDEYHRCEGLDISTEYPDEYIIVQDNKATFLPKVNLQSLTIQPEEPNGTDD